ncbi:MAG: mitochondrial 37S ribosomal protein nam9 [Pycnora praestabilis]|nr:MAG: mitochondrial 37S ribosomal protein nam9 [Pycnora praestabilis]
MRKKFHGLKRIKIRQSWSKWNLYNLSRQTIPPAAIQTFFQQKWNAKSLTRAYHGEQIREKQWERMFRPHMASVVPMDHRYLAEFDGSEQAAGRGSGLDVKSEKGQRASGRPRLPTPFMHMTYAPTERRLDTAIFRALFASSTRQARQFVVHGSVKVNGKKMIYPGYLLNPGDMFQVEPERVLFATGAPKDKRERRAGRILARKSSAVGEAEGEGGVASETATATAINEGGDDAIDAPSTPENPRVALSTLLTRAKAILSDPKDTLSGKRKQDLRAFQRTLKKTLSRSKGSTSTSVTDDLDAQLLELTSRLAISDPSTKEQGKPDSEDLSPDDKKALKAALKQARENPIDATKPYATPWRPRDYMSAFAFIPRFLEVNQSICSAVYLRHPVARPGLAEVPTPFHLETSQLAHTWYLRRR